MKNVQKSCILFCSLFIISGCATTSIITPSGKRSTSSTEEVKFVAPTSIVIYSSQDWTANYANQIKANLELRYKSKDIFINPGWLTHHFILDIAKAGEVRFVCSGSAIFDPQYVPQEELKFVCEGLGINVLYRISKKINSNETPMPGPLVIAAVVIPHTWGELTMGIEYFDWQEKKFVDSQYGISAKFAENVFNEAGSRDRFHMAFSKKTDELSKAVVFLYNKLFKEGKYLEPVLPSSDPHLLKGIESLEDYDYDNALGEFKLFIESHPDQPIGYYELGEVFLAKGSYDSALEQFNKVISIDPQVAPAYRKLGRLYCRLSQFDKAEEVYKKALDISPSYKEVYSDLKSLYASIETAKEIKKEIEKKKEEIIIAEKEKKLRPKLAIVPFDNTTRVAKETDYGNAISEMLTTSLIQTQCFIIPERAQLEKIIQEQSLSLSGIVDSEAAVRIGKVLGVKFLLIGSVGQIGNMTEIDTRLIDVETGGSILSEYTRAGNEAEIRQAVVSLANKIAQGYNSK